MTRFLDYDQCAQKLAYSSQTDVLHRCCHRKYPIGDNNPQNSTRSVDLLCLWRQTGRFEWV